MEVLVQNDDAHGSQTEMDDKLIEQRYSNAVRDLPYPAIPCLYRGIAIHMIELTTTVQASADQLSANLNDEAVILDLASGTYFSVNEVGAFIWGRLHEP